MDTKRPKKVGIFAEKSIDGNYLPTEFGTNILVDKEDYTKIINQKFQYGLESLEEDFQLRDLNTVLFYLNSLLGHIYSRGIPEFSPYEGYTAGAVTTHDGSVWLAFEDNAPSVVIKADKHCKCSCNCHCGGEVSKEPEEEGVAKYPENLGNWVRLATSREVDSAITDINKVTTDIGKLQTEFNEYTENTKGISGISIKDTNKGKALVFEYYGDNESDEVLLKDLTQYAPKLDEEGYLVITNADGSTTKLEGTNAKKLRDGLKTELNNKISDINTSVKALEIRVKNQESKEVNFEKVEGITNDGTKYKVDIAKLLPNGSHIIYSNDIVKITDEGIEAIKQPLINLMHGGEFGIQVNHNKGLKGNGKTGVETQLEVKIGNTLKFNDDGSIDVKTQPQSLTGSEGIKIEGGKVKIDTKSFPNTLVPKSYKQGEGIIISGDNTISLDKSKLPKAEKIETITLVNGNGEVVLGKLIK